MHKVASLFRVQSGDLDLLIQIGFVLLYWARSASRTPPVRGVVDSKYRNGHSNDPVMVINPQSTKTLGALMGSLIQELLTVPIPKEIATHNVCAWM